MITARATSFEQLRRALTPRLREALDKAGATTAGVVARFLAPSESAATVLTQLLTDNNDDCDLTEDELLAFVELQAFSRKEAERLRRGALLGHAWHHTLAVEKKRRLDEYEAKERAFRWQGPGVPTSQASSLLPRPAPPISTTHRTSFGRLATLACVSTRARREHELRRRYIEEMVGELIEIDSPSARQAAASADPRSVLALMAAGRRAQTIRTRLRAWKTFKRWLTITHGQSWPASWMAVLDYCRTRAAEPCGRSTLLGIFGGIAFMEKAGGFSGELAHTTNPLFKEAARELCVGITSRAGGVASHSAYTVPTALLIRLEAIVLDLGAASWYRAYAWWKLVQTWSALRFGDHAGLAPSGITVTQEGLEFDLLLTKTTGEGKKIERRPSGVSREAFYVHADWVSVGLEIWSSIAPHARDFFLVAPLHNLHDTTPREMKYGEAAGWSRALWKMAMSELEDVHIAEATAALFTEHSGRSYVASAALAMGALESYLLPVGGWSATPARSYMRTARRRLFQAQAQVAKAGRERRDGCDEFGESEGLARIADRLKAGGYDEKQVEMLRQFLTTFPLGSLGKPLWQGFHEEKEDQARMEGGSSDANTAGGVATTQRAGGGAPSSARVSDRADGLMSESKGAHRPPPQADQALGTERLPAGVKGYVVSISGKKGFRRLHSLGRCWRVPGVDYARYEWLGTDPPGAHLYDDYCGKCWRSTGPVQERPPVLLASDALDDVSPASEDESSSTSDGE